MVGVVPQWALRGSFSANLGGSCDAVVCVFQKISAGVVTQWVLRDSFPHISVEVVTQSAGVVTQCSVRGSCSPSFGLSCDAVRSER